MEIEEDLAATVHGPFITGLPQLAPDDLRTFVYDGFSRLRQRLADNLLDAERRGRIEAPTQLIWGRQNPFGKLDEAEFIGASVPGRQTEIYDDFGHWSQFEKSERFNRDVVTFLTATSTV